MNAKMRKQWQDNPVCQFLDSACENNFSYLHSFSASPCLKAMFKIDSIFLQYAQVHFSLEDHILPSFLTRCRSAYLASARLGTSGQVVEAYMVIRGCLEIALYAFYIHSDTEYVYLSKDGKEVSTGAQSGTVRAQKRLAIWLNRNTEPKAKKKCRDVFSYGNAIDALIAMDESLGKDIDALYIHTIDYGAHPNFYGLASTCTWSTSGGLDEYLLPPDSDQFKVCIQTLVAAGACSLLIFDRMFKKYLKDDTLLKEICTVVRLFPKNLKRLNNT